MELKEITDLIKIRDYVCNTVNNSHIDRSTVSVMNGMLLLLDNKILKLLQSEEFKDYVEYKDVKKAIADVARITNIKSGLSRQ